MDGKDLDLAEILKDFECLILQLEEAQCWGPLTKAGILRGKVVRFLEQRLPGFEPDKVSDIGYAVSLSPTS